MRWLNMGSCRKMESDYCKLFIGGISWDTNEDHLKEYFKSYGEVVEAVIMKDRMTGRTRGFGFVVFADPSVAEIVVMGKHMIDGRMVEAKKAVPRENQHILNRSKSSIHGSSGPAHTRKIFVGGLASTVTESDFKNYFHQFGMIVDVVVMYDHNTQRPRGFGFITYDSEDAVEKVLLKTFHELNGKLVEVKRAVPKVLSPRPIQSLLGGYNYDLNRLNSFLNGYTQNYNPNSVGGHIVRMDDRFSPIVGSRSRSPSFGLHGCEMGMNFEVGLNPYYNVNSNRYDNGGSVSVLSSPTRNVWGDGGYFGLESGLIGGKAFGNSRTNLGSPPISVQGGGGGSGSVGRNLGYESGDNIYGLGMGGYVRNNGFEVTSTPSYAASNDGYNGVYGNFYGGGSVYGAPTRLSRTSVLDGSDSFGYGLRDSISDITDESYSGYVGYNLTDRQSNRGIAA